MDNIGTDGKEIKATAHLLLASGDIPGIATLCNHTGHHSYYGCHTCNIRTDRLQSSTGVGSAQYFAGTLEPNYTERNRTHANHITILAPTEGIRGPTQFALLIAFHSPYFWGKDEMHLFRGNLGPHLWKMTNPDSGTPFSLTLDTRKKIIAYVLVRSGQARAVDWIFMLVYTGPTLFIEAFVAKSCSPQAVVAFISLLTEVSVSLKWSIYPEDIDRIDHAESWHSFAWSILDHSLYTANLHYIQHIASMIRVIGPPRAYSARSAERTIRLTSKCIKSKSAAGQNASNELYRLVACRNVMNSKQIIESNMMQDKGTNITNKDESFHEKQQEGVERVYIDTNIIVGTQYYSQGNLFGSAIHLTRTEARISNFVQLSTPFDVNAKSPNLPKDLQWGTYYGEIVMFFAHTYNGLGKLLVFARLYSNLSLNGAGIPFGSQSHGSTQGKLYVTDAQDIEGLCGYIQSATMEGQYYYVMTDLIPNDISELGDLVDDGQGFGCEFQGIVVVEADKYLSDTIALNAFSCEDQNITYQGCFLVPLTREQDGASTFSLFFITSSDLSATPTSDLTSNSTAYSTEPTVATLIFTNALHLYVSPQETTVPTVTFTMEQSDTVVVYVETTILISTVGEAGIVTFTTTTNS
ncbi:hypothetical protein BDA99DRAFT_556814 [Phascolomyces articulosus]|uniref:Uncharacterized protein n=1 Tax=Phascolomyces articulosus TaxID=60185 RepID=A0AAD5PGP1_9FUNG|nr:hypothetical protein BDA99DRAFT_556814 [Phascolomyces articulosus]